MAKIKGQETDITVVRVKKCDYISLTDMAMPKKVEAGQPILLRTGYGTDIHLNFSGLGKL